MSLFKSGFFVSIATLISRVFGYLRDVFMASTLGLSYLSDAFTLAFKLPNLFRTIFAEGALNSVFIPFFIQQKNDKGETYAIEIASTFFTFLLLATSLVVIIVEIQMPLIINFFASGFKQDTSKLELTILLARITFPYLIFISLSSLFISIMNSYRKFFIAALSPIILNVVMIISLLTSTKNSEVTVINLSIAVLIGGAIQLILNYYFIFKNNIKLRISNLSNLKDLKKMLKNMLPIIFGSGITQINLWVGTIIASKIPAAISIIYYAERLNQFPLAIIGTAVGTVLLPELSKIILSKDVSQTNKTQNNALIVALFFTIPSCFALISIGNLIIEVLFERQAFLSQDTYNVASTLAIIACGLPSFVILKVLAPRFYAAQDTKTPVVASIISIIINIILCLVLIKEFSFRGIALASVISGWINVFILFGTLYSRYQYRIDKISLKRIIKIVFSASLMFITLKLLSNFLEIRPFLKLLVSIIIGSIVYFSASYLVGLFKNTGINFREFKIAKK
jgi:putative peptidoglycan lipid II flippase